MGSSKRGRLVETPGNRELGFLSGNLLDGQLLGIGWLLLSRSLGLMFMRQALEAESQSSLPCVPCGTFCLSPEAPMRPLTGLQTSHNYFRRRRPKPPRRVLGPLNVSPAPPATALQHAPCPQ